ncbi:unnamed protein product (mitochondrion) [Plasmodiophora brassicae]|uniref:DYW domain-containing protein n=1 Tax=Plasmodiophora brassicae TaxID=37360 RepID=A0A0G4ISX9_PLABS|nr:hypothetical protein PBRA_006358 [Plasmodiophora brassicae]SPQ95180.1 unnamed protein product [Plasmodiophora brassicae]
MASSFRNALRALRVPVLRHVRRSLCSHPPAPSPLASPAFNAFLKKPSAALACAVFEKERDVDRVWAVYERVVGDGLPTDIDFFLSIMSFCKSNAPAKAPLVLDTIAARSLVISDSLFALFIQACRSAVPPLAQVAVDRYTKYAPCSMDVMISMLELCLLSNQPDLALPLIADAITNNAEFTSKLMELSAQCCSDARNAQAADLAEQLLDGLLSQRYPACRDIPTYLNLTRTLLSQCRFELAVSIVQVLTSVGLNPTASLSTLILTELARHGHIDEAMTVFRILEDRAAEISTIAFVELVTACGTCRSWLPALRELHQYACSQAWLKHDDVVCALISSYDRCKDLESTEVVFQARSKEGPLSESVYAAFIAALGHRGLVRGAIAMFVQLRSLKLPLSLTTFSTLVSLLYENDKLSRPMRLFEQMCSDKVPVDRPLLAKFVNACGHIGDVAGLVTLQDFARSKGFLDSDLVVSAFISGYSCSSHLDLAMNVFQAAEAGASSYNAIIAAYGHHAKLDLALATFETMKAAAVNPNPDTLASLLVGCSHVGDLDRATVIVAEFAGDPKTSTLSSRSLNCLIDLHGRAGNLDIAERIARGSPGSDIACWTTLLAACRWWNDTARGKRVFEHMLTIPAWTPKDLAIGWMLLANTFARCQQYYDLAYLRTRMKTQYLVGKVPGRTWLQIPNARSLEFVTDDPLLKEYEFSCKHTELMERLAESGYTPDVTVVMKQTESEDDARRSVSVHSEKIAIVCALIYLPESEPIRAVKNVPICIDCHEAAKRASALYKREIYIRDAHRHHHFRDGACTCGDYW